MRPRDETGSRCERLINEKIQCRRCPRNGKRARLNGFTTVHMHGKVVQTVGLMEIIHASQARRPARNSFTKDARWAWLVTDGSKKCATSMERNADLHRLSAFFMCRVGRRSSGVTSDAVHDSYRPLPTHAGHPGVMRKSESSIMIRSEPGAHLRPITTPPLHCAAISLRGPNASSLQPDFTFLPAATARPLMP